MGSLQPACSLVLRLVLEDSCGLGEGGNALWLGDRAAAGML